MSYSRRVRRYISNASNRIERTARKSTHDRKEPTERDDHPLRPSRRSVSIEENAECLYSEAKTEKNRARFSSRTNQTITTHFQKAAPVTPNCFETPWKLQSDEWVMWNCEKRRGERASALAGGNREEKAREELECGRERGKTYLSRPRDISNGSHAHSEIRYEETQEIDTHVGREEPFERGGSLFPGSLTRVDNVRLQERAEGQPRVL